MGVGDLSPLPKDMLVHVDVEGIRLMSSQLRMVHGVVIRKWTCLGMFLDGFIVETRTEDAER